MKNKKIVLVLFTLFLFVIGHAQSTTKKTTVVLGDKHDEITLMIPDGGVYWFEKEVPKGESEIGKLVLKKTRESITFSRFNKPIDDAMEEFARNFETAAKKNELEFSRSASRKIRLNQSLAKFEVLTTRASGEQKVPANTGYYFVLWLEGQKGQSLCLVYKYPVGMLTSESLVEDAETYVLAIFKSLKKTKP